MRRISIPTIAIRAAIGLGSLTLVSTALSAPDNSATVTADDTRDNQRAAGQMIKPFFGDLDCEKLGYVQPGEVDEHAGPIFMSFDIDRSQGINEQEWRSYPFMRDKPLMLLSFSIADRDHNGSVSFREFINYLRSAVVALDLNGDGELHPNELQQSLPGANSNSK